MADEREEAADRLIQRLSSSSRLGENDQRLVREFGFTVENCPSGHDIVLEGSKPRRSCLIVDGITSRYQDTRQGERQIQAVQIMGDIPDILSLHLQVMDHGLRTLTPCKLAFVTHDEILSACARSPSLAAALWRETLIDAAIYRTSILRIGKLVAVERVAHLICELRLRLEAVGGVNGDGFPLRMTQQEIGDLLALSFVSVNRALRELREEGLATMANSRVTVMNWDGLVERAQFDPTYLHQIHR